MPSWLIHLNRSEQPCQYVVRPEKTTSRGHEVWGFTDPPTIHQLLP